MKKRIFALIAVLCVAAMALAACGGGGSAPATTEAAAGGGDAAEDTTEAATEAPAAAAESYDVGDFTVALPAGWTAFPQNDVFGDKDEDGNYPLSTDTIYLSKDAKDEWDLFSAPYVYIVYYSPSTTIMSSKDTWYENVEDLDVTVDGTTIDEAYEGDSTIVENWRYQIIQLSTDNAQFMVTIPTIEDGKETGYSFDDPDITTILKSLAEN